MDPLHPNFYLFKRVSSERVQIIKTCTDESQISRNERCYLCRCRSTERSFLVSLCQWRGLHIAQVAFSSGADNVFFFVSGLHLFDILMTHNELDSKLTAAVKQRCGTEICACSEQAESAQHQAESCSLLLTWLCPVCLNRSYLNVTVQWIIFCLNSFDIKLTEMAQDKKQTNMKILWK